MQIVPRADDIGDRPQRMQGSPSAAVGRPACSLCFATKSAVCPTLSQLFLPHGRMPLNVDFRQCLSQRQDHAPQREIPSSVSSPLKNSENLNPLLLWLLLALGKMRPTAIDRCPVHSWRQQFDAVATHRRARNGRSRTKGMLDEIGAAWVLTWLVPGDGPLSEVLRTAPPNHWKGIRLAVEVR